APVVAVGQDGVFEGYASLLGVPDLGKDVVSPGAFAESLARRGVSGVRLLFQHDPAAPLGRWVSIAEDARGLRVRGKLNLAVARAREIHALLREGAIDGLSIGFRVERARNERATGLRRLEKLDLWEISIVTFPMLPGARVSGVKRTDKPSPSRGEGPGRAHPLRQPAAVRLTGAGHLQEGRPSCRHRSTSNSLSTGREPINDHPTFRSGYKVHPKRAKSRENSILARR
ncbi:MAG: Gene Transfer Agent prohead protease, partial [uncultured Microvirga sp.]